MMIGKTWMEAFFLDRQVSDQLRAMSHRQRLAFAATCANRSLSKIDLSSEEVGEPRSPESFHTALTVLWRHVESGVPKSELVALKKRCLSDLPDPDVDSHGAHSACFAVVHAIGCGLEEPQSFALDAAEEAYSAWRIDERLALDGPVTIDILNERERASPILQREIALQRKALDIALEQHDARREHFAEIIAR